MTSPSRRTVAQGLAWSVPAVAVAAAAPAFAVSASAATATSTAAHMYTTARTKFLARTCDPATQAQKSYIDTMPGGSPEFTSPTNPPNSPADGRRDPRSSNGIWIESSDRAGGTAFLQRASITYEFTDSRGNPAPVSVINCPDDAPGDENLQRRWGQQTTWTSCNILNGWTVTQPAPHQITLTWSTPMLIDVSTSTRGSGWASGYFVNFFFTECVNGPKMRSYKSMTYYDANGPQYYDVETRTTDLV